MDHSIICEVEKNWQHTSEGTFSFKAGKKNQL